MASTFENQVNLVLEKFSIQPPENADLSVKLEYIIHAFYKEMVERTKEPDKAYISNYSPLELVQNQFQRLSFSDSTCPKELCFPRDKMDLISPINSSSSGLWAKFDASLEVVKSTAFKAGVILCVQHHNLAKHPCYKGQQ